MAEENYGKMADDDAREMVEHFMDEIVRQIVEDGKASDDYNNDYPDGDAYHHESHVDRDYSLKEAAELLDQLDQYEETDAGLWEGQLPREAISTQAAFTYGNAVSAEWNRLIEAINDEVGLIPDEMRQENIEKRGETEKRISDFEEGDPERVKLETELEKLEDEDALEDRIERAVRRAAEIAAGIKRRMPEGPKEWLP